MFKKLIEGFQESHVKKLYQSGKLCCPDCGAVAKSLPENWEEAMRCDSCSARASLMEWASSSTSDRKDWKSEKPPAGTKIVRKAINPDAVLWEIPASGKFGFFMVFSLFWLLITAVVSGGFLIAFLKGEGIQGGFPAWVLIPFFGIFWAVGLGMLYAGLREKYLKCRVRIGQGSVWFQKEIFGKYSEKSLDLNGVTSIDQKEFYQQNYQPVYGIEIRGAEGKIRFGSVLSAEEKAWLVSEFRKQLSILRGEKQTSSQSPVSHGTGKSVFSIPFPKPKFTELFGSFFLILFGFIFLSVGLYIIGSDSNSTTGSDLSSWFDNGFRLVWIFFSSFPIVGGFVMMVKTCSRMRTDRRIEGNEAQVAIRVYKNHLIVSDQSFPRREITDVRASDVGAVNNSRMSRVELIVSNRVETISHWMNEDVADQFVSELRSALSK